MNRSRLKFSVVGLGLCVVAGLLALGGFESAPAGHAAATPAKVTTIVVTAGKPSELAFKLSKFSALPAGPITFKVTNMGLGFHDFKICTTPVTSLAKNACLGKVTKLLHHGDTATLTVTLTKHGKYEYLCAVAGHAAAGMKGLLGVGVTVSTVGTTTSTNTTTTTTKTTTTNNTTTTTKTTTTTGGGECPPGQTIAANGGRDEDADDDGAPSDLDGCL